MWKLSRTAPFAGTNQRRGSPRHLEGWGNLTGPLSIWLRKRKHSRRAGIPRPIFDRFRASTWPSRVRKGPRVVCQVDNRVSLAWPELFGPDRFERGWRGSSGPRQGRCESLPVFTLWPFWVWLVPGSWRILGKTGAERTVETREPTCPLRAAYISIALNLPSLARP